MELTNKDYYAIDQKSENPNKEVKCPRCGGSMVIEYHGNSYITKCEHGCISETSRGL